MTAEGAADVATHLAPIVTCPSLPIPAEGRGMPPSPTGRGVGSGGIIPQRTPGLVFTAGGAENAEVDG